MEKELKQSIYNKLFNIYNDTKKTDTYFTIKINSNTQLWIQVFFAEVYIEFQVKNGGDECFGEYCINLNGWAYNTNNIEQLLDETENLLAEVEDIGTEQFIKNHEGEFI